MIVGMLICWGSKKLGKPIAKSKRSECNNKENVPDKFSVYATPTLFLLDVDNTILAKPNTYIDLLDYIGDE